LTWNLAAA
jgi:hypothetical protein